MSRGFGLAIAGLVLAGCYLLWLATRWGIGLYTDSIVYVGTARSILAGAGVSYFDDVGRFAPVIQYPPLYPAIVAALSMTGLDALESARWLSIVCYGANALLVGYMVYYSSSSHSASLLAALLALTAFPMVYIHSQALTEPPFIFLILLGFVLLERYLNRPRRWLLYSCALCIGISCLVRYVGLAFVIAGGLAVLWLGDGNWLKRFVDTIKFGVISSLPLAAWLVRNSFSAGNPVNRTFGFHPPPLRDFLPILDTMAQWLLPIAMVEGAPWFGRLVVGILIIILIWLASKADFGQTKLPRLIGFCVGGYALFLLISWTLNDQPLYFDTRTMALPYVGLMILAVCIGANRLRISGWPVKSWRRFTVHCVLILAAALSTVNSALWLQQSYASGIGYATDAWRSSELLKFVKASAEAPLIYSNAPDFIYTLTGRSAIMIPHKIHPWTRQPNQQLSAETAAMREQLKTPNAVLIYFNGDDRLWYLPSEEELATKLSLQVVKTAADGRIYSLKNVSRAAQN
ncbi:MAG TPA: phospholipid carrier-dependent glycosyltransferase [Candidatus Binatus sp.]|nr:phospholipid carrier-dependent glycosyltransferase [Candidatus Binatus sp.]